MAGVLVYGRKVSYLHYIRRRSMATSAGYSWTIAALPCVNVQMIQFCHTNAMMQRVA
jgi:hypothetical protein